MCSPGAILERTFKLLNIIRFRTHVELNKIVAATYWKITEERDRLQMKFLKPARHHTDSCGDCRASGKLERDAEVANQTR